MRHHQSSDNDKLMQFKRSGCSANDFNYNHRGLVHVTCFHCTRLALLPFVLTEAEKIFSTSLTHISTVSPLLCNTFIAHLTDVVHA